MADTIVCSACLTEACWQGVLMCEDARRAGVRFAGAPRRKPMADHPDLTAELDVAEDIVTGRVEAVVTEWGVRSPSGYVTRLGSDEEAGHPAPPEVPRCRIVVGGDLAFLEQHSRNRVWARPWPGVRRIA